MNLPTLNAYDSLLTPILPNLSNSPLSSITNTWQLNILCDAFTQMINTLLLQPRRPIGFHRLQKRQARKRESTWKPSVKMGILVHQTSLNKSLLGFSTWIAITHSIPICRPHSHLVVINGLWFRRCKVRIWIVLDWSIIIQKWKCEKQMIAAIHSKS